MLVSFIFFFFNDTATTEIYTLSLHDALPILVRLLFRNIIIVGSCYHIGGSDELALLQVHEIDVLRSLFQVCSCWQDRDALEFIVCEVRKDRVHLLDLVGRARTRQKGQILAVVFSGLIQWIQVPRKVGIGTSIKRCILILMM